MSQLSTESQRKLSKANINSLLPPNKYQDPNELVFYGKTDIYLNGNNGKAYCETKKEARQKVLNNLNTSGFRGGKVADDIKAFKKIDPRVGEHCLKPSFIVRKEKRWGLNVKPNYIITYRKPSTVKSAAKACTERYR